MKHLNYCFKDGKTTPGEDALSDREVLQFILSPLTISLKNPSLLNLLSVRIFSVLRRYLLPFLCFFRGKEEFREEKRVNRKIMIHITSNSIDILSHLLRKEEK